MRILFLSHRLPYAPNRGDRIRAFHLLRALSSLAAVGVISLVHDDEEARHVRGVERLVAGPVRAVRVSRAANAMKAPLALATGRPLTHALLDGPALPDALQEAVAEDRPDLVVAYCSGMARLALERPLAGIPFVHDMVDVDSAKWAALAAGTSGPRGWVYRLEARRLREFEAEVTRRAACTLVVNDRERRTLEEIAPGTPVAVIGNGVDVSSFNPPAGPAGGARVVFTGVFDYAPNVEGATWFVREVWPTVLSRHPDATLLLVGARPARALRTLASRARSVVVTGAVPDVRPYLWDAAVAVAPLRTARGVQNKVLEALAAGLPVVTTPAVAGGLPGETLAGCVVADDRESFAAGVVRLLSIAPGDRRRLARTVDLEPLTWEKRLAALGPLVAQAASSTSSR